MAHITIMSGSTALTNKHLRPDFGKRDSHHASNQQIDRAGLDPQKGGDPETLGRPKTCLQKYKKYVYLGGVALVVTVTVIVIIMAALGAFDTSSS